MDMTTILGVTLKGWLMIALVALVVILIAVILVWAIESD